jgi:hypothetical protein
MISIKNIRSVLKNNRMTSKRIFTVTLSLTLMVFVFTMSPIPALNLVSAAALTNVLVTPASNIVNESANYNFFFKTSTTATINKIEISFPSSFDLSGIRFVERNNIGSGTLSVAGSTLTYTLISPESVPAGITIRLEIGRIIATVEGSFTVSIKTLNSQGGTIDGPTTSGPFVIKSITSSDIADNSIQGIDVSPAFMKTITLQDDATGHAHGWDPNGAQLSFNIVGVSDIISGVSTTVIAQDNIPNRLCEIDFVHPEGFSFVCNQALLDASALTFTVVNAPVTPCCSPAISTTSSTNENNISPSNMADTSSSASSSTISSPFDSIGTND